MIYTLTKIIHNDGALIPEYIEIVTIEANSPLHAIYRCASLLKEYKLTLKYISEYGPTYICPNNHEYEFWKQ